MEKEFIPYEQALALKELGFDEPCFGRYNPDNALIVSHTETYNTDFRKTLFTQAPTFSQAFRWFREKYGLFSIILPYLIIGNQWYYKITNRNNSSGLPFEEGFETYEEAELACLIKLIEICKNK